jgi:hypothetical protein
MQVQMLTHHLYNQLSCADSHMHADCVHIPSISKPAVSHLQQHGTCSAPPTCNRVESCGRRWCLRG